MIKVDMVATGNNELVNEALLNDRLALWVEFLEPWIMIGEEEPLIAKNNKDWARDAFEAVVHIFLGHA